MNKIILILNLTVKTLVELIFVFLFIGTIGVVIFVTTYLVNTIKNAINDYKQLTRTY